MKQLAGAVLCLALLTAACGNDAPVESKAPPKSVPDSVVPPMLNGDKILLKENVDDETQKAFANGGEFSLVADGRLWELRQGARLVGALQVATVVNRIDLSQGKERRSMLRQILPGNLNELMVDDVPVWAAESNDKVVYVWFATGTFQVLQLKGANLDPEGLLREVIGFQRKSGDWLPLPPEAYDDET